MIVFGLLLGIVLGGLSAYVVMTRRQADTAGELRDALADLRTIEEKLASSEDQLRIQAAHHEKQLELVQADRKQLSTEMESISNQVLRKTSQQLSEALAQQQKLERQEARTEMEKRTTEIRTAVTPVTEKLVEMQKKVEELERERAKSHVALDQQIKHLKEGVGDLANQAGGLTAALKKPAGRGSWGEIQLRNVIEMAGMLEHCDFETQVTVHDEGSRLRPDVVVNMPGGRSVVVDAKVPMEAFLSAQEALDDDTREAFLAKHAQQVRNHVTALRKKEYQAQFDQSPDLVVMFVPSEGIYHSALAQDSTLLEYGLSEKVLIATPTTLIGILQAINYGWGQDRIGRSAQEIADAGRELHKRVATFAEPLARVGKSIDSAASNYNKAIGSFERMVLPQLRKIESAGAKSPKEIEEMPNVETMAREITAEIPNALELPEPDISDAA
ncbi:MAG TPA: DNA recombination protein RmuC [Solirubrobacterales bacterium]|nr:DNA recombination protein RmuC [Solirubrobacterales bacterium]